MFRIKNKTVIHGECKKNNNEKERSRIRWSIGLNIRLKRLATNYPSRLDHSAL